MQTQVENFRKHGAAVVALCPQRQEFSDNMVAELKLNFPILLDRFNKVSTVFGLTIETPPKIIAAEKSLGLDLPAHNETDNWDLPIPARYVIDRDGTIRYVSLHIDHRLRSDPADCLKVMNKATD